MADTFSVRERSRIMARVRSRGNVSTERIVLLLLRQKRISGWRRHLPLPGKPDFCFPSKRLAVFVDGCFWHMCSRCFRLPADHRSYWQTKVERNRRRDRKASRQLREQGWRVLRIWEHELRDARGRARVLRHLGRVLEAVR